MKTRLPIYREDGQTYHADSCSPLIEAAERGDITLHARSRGTYPGTPLRQAELPGVRSIGYWDATTRQHWGLPWHRNEGIEFTLLETGRMPFALEQASMELKPGQITITRPWQPHRVGDPHIGVGRLYWLILDLGVRQPHQSWTWPSWLLLTKEDRQALTRFLRENEQPVWDASPPVQACVRRMGEALAGGDRGSDISRLAVCINQFLVDLLDMFREHEVRLSKSLTSARRTTELFLQALEQNLDEEWTLEAMARACGLGITRFVHYCREITNQTPVHYLNRLRLERAAALLLEHPSTSITEVAQACGFSTSQYFATLFRKTMHCSPTAYRRAIPEKT